MQQALDQRPDFIPGAHMCGQRAENAWNSLHRGLRGWRKTPAKGKHTGSSAAVPEAPDSLEGDILAVGHQGVQGVPEGGLDGLVVLGIDLDKVGQNAPEELAPFRIEHQVPYPLGIPLVPRPDFFQYLEAGSVRFQRSLESASLLAGPSELFLHLHTALPGGREIPLDRSQPRFQLPQFLLRPGLILRQPIQGSP